MDTLLENCESVYTMQTLPNILVTGHLGFIGSHLIEKYPWAHGIDLKSGGDIRTFQSDEKYDVIFHCAAKASVIGSFQDPKEFHEHNVLGTLNLLEYARKTGANIVFSSSSSVYGDSKIPTKEDELVDPMSPYAIQKLICEEYLKLYWKLGVKSIALRYFNVFGERQPNDGAYKTVLSTFFGQYKDGKPFSIVGGGKQRRDFVYVKDVVEANVKAYEWLLNASDFEIFNIGSGKNYSVNEVTDMIDPEYPRFFLEKRKEPQTTLADISKAEKLLNWKPTVNLQSWINSVK